MYQWSPCVTGADYQMAVDWDNNNDFTDAHEDVTTNLLDQGITVEYGRDQDRMLSPSAIGRAGFALCNTSRDYSPENTTSPLYGELLPGRRVRFQAEFQGTTYPLFAGRLDDFEVRADRATRDVVFSATDGLATLQQTTLSTAVYSSLRTGDIINRILDEVGWSAGRDLDPGATVVPWWWSEANAFDELQEVVRSEGPPAIAYVAPDGTFTFRDRHHRILDAEALTSQAAFAAGRSLCDSPAVTGLDYTDPFTYSHGMRDLVNAVSFSVEQRVPDTGTSDVWSSNDTITIQNGETVSVHIETQDPFIDFSHIGATWNFSVTDLQASVSRTSGRSARLNLKSVGGTAVVTLVTFVARSLPVVRTIKVMAEDVVSIAEHGRKEYEDDVPWSNAEDAKAIASLILAHYAERRPLVKMRVVSQDPDHLVQLLSRQISDLITIRNDELGLDDAFHIESINHEMRRIDPSTGPVHACVFGAERRLIVAQDNPFTFDKVGAGFDQGRFGLFGVDDPSTVFIFDHATQGQFDTGLFGT